ncbi:MAG: signal peptidase I [Actinomycetota bacterium]
MPPDEGPEGSPEGETPPALSPEVEPATAESGVDASRGRGRRRKKRQGEAGGREAPQSFWAALREVIIILVIAALVAVFIQSFILKGLVIPSGSMEKTLGIGDRVFAEKITYYFRKPKRGDVIVFRYPPSDPNALNTTNLFYWPIQQILETFHVGYKGTTPYVKRVVATEGETLELRKGKLYVNGKRIDEPYIVPDSADFGPVVVPEGTCYGFGDNRPNSRDSRFFGPIPYRAIIGRVFLVWWPFSHFGRPEGKPSG